MTTLHTLLTGTTAVTTGRVVEIRNVPRTIQATLTGTAPISATVDVEFSNDGVNWVELVSLSLADTGVLSDGLVSTAPWRYLRASVSAISGTGATVNAIANG